MDKDFIKFNFLEKTVEHDVPGQKGSMIHWGLSERKQDILKLFNIKTEPNVIKFDFLKSEITYMDVILLVPELNEKRSELYNAAGMITEPIDDIFDIVNQYVNGEITEEEFMNFEIDE